MSVGTLVIVAGGHVAASLGLMAIFALNFVVGTTVFLFSGILVAFPTLGLVSG